MACQDLSITRALLELKLVEKRIEKATEKNTYIKLKAAEERWDVKAFQDEAKAAFQSIQDLIRNRYKLKAAIISSNANTKVKIGNVEYTVAEVIDRKTSIKFEKSLLESLVEQNTNLQRNLERNNATLESKLERLIELNFSKDRKSNESDIANITKSFYEANKSDCVDPINVKAAIAMLRNSIEEFEKEADTVLSESNAQTRITI